MKTKSAVHDHFFGESTTTRGATFSKRLVLGMMSVLCLCASWLPAAETPSNVEQVFLKEGRTILKRSGEGSPLAEKHQLSKNITVLTNGAYQVSNGAERPLKEGQVLRADGYLVDADGTLTPVWDRVVKEKANVVRVYQDGASRVIKESLKLPSGAVISPDGMMMLSDGRHERLIEGQMLQLDGTALPAKDTVTLRDGVVFIQKEGNQFKLPRERTFMMNDGTKVFGTGKMMKRGGTEIPLKEGEIIILPGVTF